MKFAAINVADAFKKGQSKKIFIDLDSIASIEEQTFGVAKTYRVVLKASQGSFAPPKTDDKYPKGYYEPYAYTVSLGQGQALLAQVNALTPILDICVDAAGNEDTAAAEPTAASLSKLGF